MPTRAMAPRGEAQPLKVHPRRFCTFAQQLALRATSVKISPETLPWFLQALLSWSSTPPPRWSGRAELRLRAWLGKALALDLCAVDDRTLAPRLLARLLLLEALLREDASQYMDHCNLELLRRIHWRVMAMRYHVAGECSLSAVLLGPCYPQLDNPAVKFCDDLERRFIRECLTEHPAAGVRAPARA